MGPERVAAFIGEPVQGAGGVIIPPETYWPEIQRICDQYGILLISDEVICGFGRTGQWFGCEHLRHPAGLHDHGQGAVLGLPAHRRRDGGRSRRAHADREGRRVRAWIHLFGTPGLQRRGAGEPSRSSSARSWSSMCATPPGPTCSSAGRSWPTIRWWGRPAAWACWAPWSWCKTKGPVRTWFEPRGKVGERCRDNAIANGLVMRATRDTMIIAPPLVITRGRDRRAGRQGLADTGHDTGWPEAGRLAIVDQTGRGACPARL